MGYMRKLSKWVKRARYYRKLAATCEENGHREAAELYRNKVALCEEAIADLKAVRGTDLDIPLN